MDRDTKLINLALDAGEIMIKNGAETFRVQDTMQRILNTTGRDKIEAAALSTVLLVTLPRAEKSPLSMMRSIHSRSINFQKVCDVNDMSRAFVSGKITLEEAIARLDNISKTKKYHPLTYVLGYGAIAGGCGLLLTPCLTDGILSTLIGILLGILSLWLDTKKMPYFLPPFLSGAFVAFCACGMQPFFPGSHMDASIVGSLMPLLPGMTFSKAMRDLLEGNIISGYTKAVEAIVIAGALAGGIGLTLSYFL